MGSIGGRSYQNGIDFYEIGNRNKVSVRRNENGELIINRCEKDSFSIRPKNMKVMIFAFCILFAFIYGFFDSTSAKVLTILAFVWIGVWGYYYVNFKNEKNFCVYRYHSAEHKALNYWDRYHHATLDCNEIMKMPSISYRCGSTLIAVLLVLGSFLTIGIILIPFLLIKVIWCIACFPLVFYLWGIGKCDFLQKLVLRNPSFDEIEVATRGLWEYVHQTENES